MTSYVKQQTRQQRAAVERAKHIRERSGPDSLEWIQSALFLYAAHQEGLGSDLHRAIWAYTAAMIDKLERILTDSKHVLGAENIAEEYQWAAKQLRVAIGRHLELLKMFAGQADVEVPEVTDEGRHMVDKVHQPSPEDAVAALRYVQGDYKIKHPGYGAVIPVDPEMI